MIQQGSIAKLAICKNSRIRSIYRDRAVGIRR